MPVARLAAALAALAVGVAAVALVALLLHRTPGPVPLTGSGAPTAAAAPAPSTRSFPAPPAGAVVFAREDGPYALALAVLPGRAQVSVLGQQGTGVSGLAVTIGGAAAKSCGRGCYTRPATPPVDVRVGSTTWRVDVPPRAPDASALVARAARTWRALRSLAFSDRLASDASHAVASSWRAQAPDRLAYHVERGNDGVIIGSRRWDRVPGDRWIESQQTPVRQPVPLWQSAVDAHVVGETGTAWRITFFDPRTPAWFAITVDKRSMHTLDLRMTTTAHFMHETYRAFDAAAPIAPPATSR
ncbi:MAG: hypothetical protein ACRDL2_08690 [Gaiellaceae bacterium]